jgi:hypothetical protein
VWPISSKGQTDEARRYLEQALQRRNGPAGIQVIHNNLGIDRFAGGAL